MGADHGRGGMSALDLRTLTDRELHDYVRATCFEMAGKFGVSASAADLEGGLALAEAPPGVLARAGLLLVRSRVSRETRRTAPPPAAPSGAA